MRGIGAALAVLAVFMWAQTMSASPRSVEVGFTNLSPLGEQGGRIVPASCNGGPNAPTYGQACTSAANSCGQTNSATYDTCGNCTATPPPDSNCPAPPTVVITATGGGGGGGGGGSTVTVTSGTQVTVTWSCPSPNTSSTNNFNSSTAASGSANLNPSSSSTYTVRCTQTGTQGSVSAIVVNPNISLTASPSRVRNGGTSVLSWYASSVTSCTLSGPSVSASATADASGNVASSASPRQTTTAAINGSSTYTLTCQTAAGPVNSSVNVAPIPVQIEI